MAMGGRPRRVGPAEMVIFAFFAVFGFIGLALLRFFWTQSDPFGGPPPLFRMVGSLIATAFVVLGFGMPLAALWRRPPSDAPSTKPPGTPGTPGSTEAPGPASGYECPNCGASLGANQEVSPSGDAKCRYCNRWWNIHRPGV